jgi:hypothetical protein|tara:strand:+ start:5202 stop:5639 length:438 start_codon:yes stop_codon:yes gene_type:complete
VVEEAARRRDDDVGVFIELLALTAIFHAAVEEREFEAKVLVIELKLFIDLHRELTGRLKDEHARVAVFEMLSEARKEREAEGSGFSGACLRAGDKVAAIQKIRDRFSLNRRRVEVAFFFDGTKDVGMKAEFTEERFRYGILCRGI